MIGDPSGKRAERPMLGAEEVTRNAEAIGRQLARFLSFEGPAGARLLNNAAWLQHPTLADFLRDAGKHFTLSYMLQKESVKSRLDTGISYTEFSYMLVQAYDFWHLFQTETCELQVGGSDQWGNITAGIELIGRREGKPAHGLVFPLVTTSAGAKFGKTEAGNIWLDPVRTSPYPVLPVLDQYRRPRHRALSQAVHLSPARRDRRACCGSISPTPASVRPTAVWPRPITTQVHGEAATQQAIEASRALFSGGSSAAVAALGDEMPTCRIPSAQFDSGLTLVEALVQSGLAKSAEARRGIEGHGFVNDEQVSGVDRRLTGADLRRQDTDSFVLLRKGKKNYMRLLIT